MGQDVLHAVRGRPGGRNLEEGAQSLQEPPQRPAAHQARGGTADSPAADGPRRQNLDPPSEVGVSGGLGWVSLYMILRARNVFTHYPPHLIAPQPNRPERLSGLSVMTSVSGNGCLSLFFSLRAALRTGSRLARPSRRVLRSCSIIRSFGPLDSTLCRVGAGPLAQHAHAPAPFGLVRAEVMICPHRLYHSLCSTGDWERSTAAGIPQMPGGTPAGAVSWQSWGTGQLQLLTRQSTCAAW